MSSKHHQGVIETWDHTAAADIANNAVVVMGGVTGVALGDIASGQTGAVAVQGTFKLPKDGATAFSQGDAVDWDGTKIIASAGSRIGFVSEDVAASVLEAPVRLER